MSWVGHRAGAGALASLLSSTTRSRSLSHGHGRLHTSALGRGSRKQTGRAGSSILCPQLLQKLTPPRGSLTQRLRHELREEGHEGRRGQLGVSQQLRVPSQGAGSGPPELLLTWL